MKTIGIFAMVILLSIAALLAVAIVLYIATFICFIVNGDDLHGKD